MSKWVGNDKRSTMLFNIREIDEPEINASLQTCLV